MSINIFHIYIYTDIYILYKEKYSPHCCQRANLRMGEFYVANKISVNTTVPGRIQDRAKPFASVKGGK